jgi:hypothetical protein
MHVTTRLAALPLSSKSPIPHSLSSLFASLVGAFFAISTGYTACWRAPLLILVSVWLSASSLSGSWASTIAIGSTLQLVEFACSLCIELRAPFAC